MNTIPKQDPTTLNLLLGNFYTLTMCENATSFTFTEQIWIIQEHVT